MTLQNLIPMLNVRRIETSLAFYCDALGFEIVSDPAAVADWRWATIWSGATELMISETETPPTADDTVDPHESTAWPVIFYFYPDDVSQLHAQLLASGFAPTPLRDTIYGMREFSLRDPDGHMLSFGQDTEEANK